MDNCILIGFPKDGKIIDMFTSGADAVLLVQAEPNAETIVAHFHIVKTGVVINTDSFEYIGKFVFENKDTLDKYVVPVARIPEGIFGIASGMTQTIAEETIHTQSSEEKIPENYKPSENEIYNLFGVEKPKKKRKYTRRKKNEEGDR